MYPSPPQTLPPNPPSPGPVGPVGGRLHPFNKGFDVVRTSIFRFLNFRRNLDSGKRNPQGISQGETSGFPVLAHSRVPQPLAPPSPAGEKRQGPPQGTTNPVVHSLRVAFLPPKPREAQKWISKHPFQLSPPPPGAQRTFFEKLRNHFSCVP